MTDAAPWGSGLRPPTDAEFAQFQALIEREAGIYLSDAKRALLISRLWQRVRALGLGSFGAYYRAVVRGDGDEQTRLVDAICTNETHFFREPHHFQFIVRALVPRWQAEARAGRRPARIRAWSAGCSTGEEPYSLAMLLLAALGDDWELELHASDLSTRALAAAGAAIYPAERLDEIPIGYRRYLLRGTGRQQGRFKIAPEARAPVRLQRLNLLDAAYGVPDGLDLLLCRNVLIYFRAETREQILRRLADKIGLGGHLLLGHAESLSSRHGLRTVVPTVYQKVAREAAS